MLYEKFKEHNPRSLKINSYHFEDVKQVLLDQYDWSFLPASAKDAISRYSMNTIEIVSMLEQYQYAEPETLTQILNYATGLCFRYFPPNAKEIPKRRWKTEQDILALHGVNGMEFTVFIGIHKLFSEAQLEVILPGKVTKIVYLLPANYEEIKDASYITQRKWNYYILFGRYINYCLENKASDLHIMTTHIKKETKYPVLCRIGPDREECTLFSLDKILHRNLIKETIKERSSNQQALLDLDAGLGIVVSLSDVFNDGSIEVRMTVEKVTGGYYCVCRIQEIKTTAMALDDLGFDEKIVRILREVTERPSGLTVITGKIRTGKNTTMASIGADLVKRDSHPSLMSFDDPIEILGDYPQTDYRGEIDLLKAGIRLSKKLDLDYVMLNEIPNAETAFGVRDLVNSSIHTLTTWHMNRIWHLPHKLFEFYGESYRDLISQINLVCNQRLYKRQCSYCQQEIHRAFYESDERIHNFFVKYGLVSSLVSQGCERCNFTGWAKGDVVVLPEILVFNQELILELFQAGRPYDMELVLIERMSQSEFSLERQMCKALTDGRLSPKDILSIV